MQTNINIPTLLNLAEEIRVRGTVQGAGFRPTVYRLAKAGDLRGEVCNDGEGVLIRVVGTVEALETFVRQLQAECPPLAKIEAIARSPLAQVPVYTDFTITQKYFGFHVALYAFTSFNFTANETPDCLNKWQYI